MDAREAALQVLYACERQGEWSDEVLRRQLHRDVPDPRDAALATRLCFGVQQNRTLLDFYLSAFCSRSLKRLETRVRLILELGAFQLLFLDRVPHRAAVDTAVSLARAHSASPRTPALVNAVLRALERSLADLPPLPREDPLEELSLRWSHPRWLTETFAGLFGLEGAAALLEADNAPVPLQAQHNPLRGSRQQLVSALEDSGARVEPHPWLEGCFLLSGSGDLENSRPFREGRFYVQDPAARLAVLAADPRPGMRVLDVCAAPGGKSFACAISMENRGEILACDLVPSRVARIRSGARRLGLSCITPRQQDGRTPDPLWQGAFDRVLVDAPCSGLGVIRKKPDIRWRDPRSLEDLPRLQGQLLESASRCVKPGGVLLYSTCTLLPRENGEVADAFLARHPDFHPRPFSLPGPAGRAEGGRVTLLPHVHGTDGFFICTLEREEEGACRM